MKKSYWACVDRHAGVKRNFVRKTVETVAKANFSIHANVEFRFALLADFTLVKKYSRSVTNYIFIEKKEKSL